MNCKEATEILDRMIFEDIPADAALMQHLHACPSCSSAYADAVKAGRIMDLVRRTEPLLWDPGDLTSGILAMVTEKPVKTSVIPLYLTRLLAAASLTLVLVFGYEQYGLVEKILALEKQSSSVIKDSRYHNLRQLATTRNISQAGFSFAGIERLISSDRPEAGIKGKVKMQNQKSK